MPLKSITTDEVAEGLVESLCGHGEPRQLLSDQGKQFKYALKIYKLHSSPYHPQSNETVERFHGTLIHMLRRALSKGIDWASQIKYCLYAIRSAPNRSTGFTPYEIVLCKNARSPLDLLVEELEVQETSLYLCVSG